MTILSSLNTAVLPTTTPVPDAGASPASISRTAMEAATATPSAVVTLTQLAPNGSPPLYSAQGLLANMAPTVTWANKSDDAVTSLMANNYQSGALTDRFGGLGSALLNRFQTADSDFAQSVQVSQPGSTGSTRQGTQADVTLTVRTKDGATVDLILHSQQDGLSVSEKSSATLSDADKNALAKLADAFQDALDGLGAVPPTLNLNGLMQFDPAVLSSVDLKSNVMTQGQPAQTIDFHADSTTRSVNVSGAAGSLKVNVDMSNPAIWGSDSQRAEAIHDYLQQFDQAGTRGHGDASLMAMFKDAFAELNGSYSTASPSLPGTSHSSALSKADHAMLSGLADFNASMTDTATSPNPRHVNEKDGFSYQLSQSTKVQGNQTNGSISQTQQSHLTASYHMPLSGNGPLLLTADKASQSYYYTLLDDTADSTVNIDNKDGKLAGASLHQSASQSTHQMKYDMGDLVSDVTLPAKQAQSQDLLALLKPFFDDGQAAQDTAQWESALSKVHDMVLLQPDPTLLKAQAGAS